MVSVRSGGSPVVSDAVAELAPWTPWAPGISLSMLADSCPEAWAPGPCGGRGVTVQRLRTEAI